MTPTNFSHLIIVPVLGYEIVACNVIFFSKFPYRPLHFDWMIIINSRHMRIFLSSYLSSITSSFFPFLFFSFLESFMRNKGCNCARTWIG